MSQLDSSGQSFYQQALALAHEEPPDNARVLGLLEKAIEHGNAEATYALGTWFLNGKLPLVEKDFTRAFELIKRAASKNVPSALFDLGVMLETGEAGELDEHRAFKCYLRAAIRGENDSIFEVGRCLYWGIGVSQDRELADIWLEYASELGSSEVEYDALKKSAPPPKSISADREKGNISD
jgi:TPR repeat protein